MASTTPSLSGKVPEELFVKGSGGSYRDRFLSEDIQHPVTGIAEQNVGFTRRSSAREDKTESGTTTKTASEHERVTNNKGLQSKLFDYIEDFSTDYQIGLREEGFSIDQKVDAKCREDFSASDFWRSNRQVG